MLQMVSDNIYCDLVFIRLNTDVNLSKKEVFAVKKAIFVD